MSFKIIFFIPYTFLLFCYKKVPEAYCCLRDEFIAVPPCLPLSRPLGCAVTCVHVTPYLPGFLGPRSGVRLHPVTSVPALTFGRLSVTSINRRLAPSLRFAISKAYLCTILCETNFVNSGTSRNYSASFSTAPSTPDVANARYLFRNGLLTF